MSDSPVTISIVDIVPSPIDQDIVDLYSDLPSVTNKRKKLDQDLEDLYGDIPETPEKKVFVPYIKSEPISPVEEAEKLRVWYWSIRNKCKHRQLITKFKQED